ncbi:MAG: topoisomerase DNA-binding C4 zinc finger domain-containing protein [Chloroflexota bacterium]|nr:topoisomerase DNA-binding C4 zinc finger domain-containing protein [Chloroflexota bacterium]MDE2942509.1 topoisomerase DNA-binding C4 zinc finger domain-containing protein [Chloroflexota bacterium]MDE3266891.1 topoisomerase DNA-binding C4 zinc finger domain-containing protein [Chloroflexota bacterium]
MAAPSCPSCEVSMVRRTNRRTGGDFWGCQRFPACRGTRDISFDWRDSRSEGAFTARTQADLLGLRTARNGVASQYGYAPAGEVLRSSPSQRSTIGSFLERCLYYAVDAAIAVMGAFVWCVIGLLTLMVFLGNPFLLLVALALNNNKKRARGRRRYRRY